MQQFEEARDLGEKISFYKAHSREKVNLSDSQSNSAHNWGADHFYTNVLLNSKLPENFLISVEKLEEIKADFEAETGSDVDINQLFENGWLRFVFGTIELPNVIRQALYHFDNVEASGINSATNGVYDDRVSCFLLDNLPKFQFLRKLKQLREEIQLWISTTQLEKLHQQHTFYFKDTPAIEQLVDKKIMTIDETNQYYTFDFAGQIGHATMEHAAGILWDRLLEDDGFSNDIERLQFWYYCTAYRMDGIDIARSFCQTSKEKFIAIALQVVLSESDLGVGILEYRKLMLDSHHLHLDQLLPGSMINSSVETIASTYDLYNAYQNFKMLNRGHGDDILVGQTCRHAIDYFIGQIVLNDVAYSFSNTFKLFDQATSKPYIFWNATLWVSNWRPDIIPFLVKNEKTASLGFSLLFEIRIDNAVKRDDTEIHRNIIQSGFHLLALYLANGSAISTSRKAEVVFQCLLKITFKKFKVYGANKPVLQAQHKQREIRISEDIKSILKTTELPGVVFDASLKYKKLFYPEFLEELFILIANHKPVDLYENGLISLPYEALDLLSLMIELGENNDNNGKRVSTETQIGKFSTTFLKTYLDKINCKKVLKRDYFNDRQLKLSLPSWSSQTENNSLINWGQILLRLEKYFILDDFLSPANLTFKHSTDKYHEYNGFTAQKLRTHIDILIIAFNDIFRNSRIFRLKGYPVELTLSKIENCLTSYITKYCLSNPDSSRFDIFDESLERWHMGNPGNELLPVIGNVINKFEKKENRQAIISELTKSDQIIRSLKMIEYVVSEDERSRLLQIVINEKSIQDILDKLSFSDTQFVIQTLSKNRDFIEQAEKALNHIHARKRKSKIASQNAENDLLYFRIKLLLAYHKADSSTISMIDEPEIQLYQGRKFAPKDEKDFYQALVFLEQKDSEKAYNIFNKQLSYSSEYRPDLALNRFASKLEWADQTKDATVKQQLYQSALDEWNDYDSQNLNKVMTSDVNEKIILNKLQAFDFLELDTNFDESYAVLDKDTQLRPHFLQLRMSFLKRRKMQAQVEQLLFDAKQFHALQSGGFPAFINDLEGLINTPATIDFLAEQYTRIFRLAPEQLVQVVPDNINDGKQLTTFLLNEIVASADQMLTKINSISTINHEDKYSDLIMLVLNNRMMNYHLSVETLRAGYSDEKEKEAKETPKDSKKKSNLGEIDFGVHSANRELLAVCEALIIKGQNTTEIQKHNLKIFNYSPSRKLYYVITYYKGATDDFETTWDHYILKVEDFIEFPKGYEINGKVDKQNYSKQNASIKVAKSNHGLATELFHIFININYKLQLKKKKVRESKK